MTCSGLIQTVSAFFFSPLSARRDTRRGAVPMCLFALSRALTVGEPLLARRYRRVGTVTSRSWIPVWSRRRETVCPFERIGPDRESSSTRKLPSVSLSLCFSRRRRSKSIGTHPATELVTVGHGGAQINVRGQDRDGVVGAELLLQVMKVFLTFSSPLQKS